ncbi:MAG: Protein N-acetyltransferase, RimJ/RimL family [Verrucomicrobia bacterium]|jgi:RimJ/RimL family protein N-acetyltransferase|nr:MAG: Protein N-acetyltransferase, RimJ/RimL family [Verrucomicrobiota bacterium]
MNQTIKKPCDCTAQELTAFEAMVTEGGEVNPVGPPQRIRNAAFLMFLFDDDCSLIGVSALKHPNPEYREEAFTSASSVLLPDDYDLELGWIFVAESHRGRGLSRELVEHLIAHVETARIYATTREANLPMRRTNERCGFRLEGSPYRSKLGNYSLVLYVRSSQSNAA